MADISDAASSVQSKTNSHATTEKKAKKNTFRWDSELIEQLINCISSYKIKMTFNGLDFDADKPKLYSELRILMAELNTENVTLFGPVSTTDFNPSPEELSSEEMKEMKETLKKEKDMITKGRNRIQEKVKDIRQCFSKAVVNGTRSGSGKIVYEHYDKLVSIWGGSANTEPLPFGVQNGDFENDDSNNDNTSTSVNNEEIMKELDKVNNNSSWSIESWSSDVEDD